MIKRKCYFKCLRTIFTIIILFYILPLCSSAESAETEFQGTVSAKSAVLYEPTSGRFLYQKCSNQRLPMASTTKMMTALVVMDKCTINDTVTISSESTGIEGSSAYLQEGDEYTVLELLYAILLQSANDAATALAYHTAGGIEEFSNLMNKKAEDLCIKNSHFTNPHGLDDSEHYTTAEDLAKIGAALLKNDILKEIVSCNKKSFTYVERTRTYINHNKLLKSYDGSIGIKTGFTKKSGRCLVSAAERNGITLISVTLDAPNDWIDHKRMLDFGFCSLELLELCHKGDYYQEIKVLGGNKESISISAKENISIIKDKNTKITNEYVSIPKYLIAPIEKNTVIGQAVFKGENIEYTVDIVANESVTSTKKHNFIDKLIKRITNIR